MEKKDNMPSWAYWGLWGIQTRKAAQLFFVISIVLALAAVALGITIKDYSFFLVLFAPVWYWASIRWADNHSAWDSNDS